MSDATVDPIREDVERALRRVVDVTVVAPWRLATWMPRHVLRCLGRLVPSEGATAVRSLTELARQAVSPAETERDGVPTPRGAPVASVATPTTSTSSASVPVATDLPIEDYESLAASQVVTRLGALTPAELRTLHAFESAHRGRRTILGKIDQLSG